jgi:hypothetical protein
VQGVHTNAHALARDVRAYRTRFQDLPRVGLHQVETRGRKRVPRNFPFMRKKGNVSRRVGTFHRGRREKRRETRVRRTCRILFFAGPIRNAIWSTRRPVRLARLLRQAACPRAEVRDVRGVLRPVVKDKKKSYAYMDNALGACDYARRNSRAVDGGR